MGTSRPLKIRGAQVRIEEIPGVHAVNTGGGDGSRPDPEAALGVDGLPVLDAESVASAAPGVRRGSIEALQNAGWRFVRTAHPPRPDEAAAKLFVMEGGRPVLSTRRLVLGLKEHVTGARMADLLAKHGVRVIAPVTFAPGVYQVEIGPHALGDVLDVAAALDAEADVDFAEPEFIEVIAGR
jgi:hypothetical protein